MKDEFLTDVGKRPLQLRLYPDDMLRINCSGITTFSNDVDHFMHEMFDCMKIHGGIGLAAPQIGIGLRVIVAEIEQRPLMLANPVIVNSTADKDWKEEGCLSLPGTVLQVERLVAIEVKARTSTGGRLHFEAEGLFARVLQHEIDHLDGVLICDKGVAGEKRP